MSILTLLLVSPCFSEEISDRNSTDQHKQVTRRLIAMFNQRDYAAVDSLISKDHVNHAIRTRPGPRHGREGVRAVIKSIESAFPDFKMKILDMIAEGDRVAYRMLFTGTHKGPYMGIEPTGRKVSFEAMHLLRFSDGKVAEHWSVRDDLTRLRQLGQFPPPTLTKRP